MGTLRNIMNSELSSEEWYGLEMSEERNEEPEAKIIVECLIESKRLSTLSLANILEVRITTVQGWLDGERINLKHYSIIKKLGELLERYGSSRTKFEQALISRRILRRGDDSMPWGPVV